MKCPFCQNQLIINNSEHYTTYHCEDNSCLIYDEMPRYIVRYQNDFCKPFYKTFYLDNLYVQIDFASNTTLISRLDVIFLVDSILVPRAIDFDLCDQNKTSNKLKTIVNFS